MQQSETNPNQKIFTIGSKVICLTISDEMNFDIDSILKVDSGNLMGELLTFSLITNRFSLLLADVSDFLRREEFKVEIAEDDLKKKRGIAELKAYNELKAGCYYDHIKKEMVNVSPINSPTKDQISNRVRVNEDHQKDENEYRDKKVALFEIIKNKDYISSIFWSCKSKLDIITKLSEKITPEEYQHEIINGQINGIMIKSTKHKI